MPCIIAKLTSHVLRVFMLPYVCEKLLHVCVMLLGVLLWGGRARGD